jgi:hypothetical protein
LKWILWSFGAGVVGLGFAVSCSNSNGGKGPGSDGGAQDVRSSMDSGSPDSGSIDSGSDDDGATVATGCYTVSGTGSARICTFASSQADAGCSREVGADSKIGSCPIADLFGCCVYTPPSDGGGAKDGGGKDTGEDADDAGVSDAGVSDAGSDDAGVNDAGADDGGGNDPRADTDDAGVNDARADDAGADNGGILTAICYYGADAGMTGHNKCTMEDFPVFRGYQWRYSLP